MRHSLIALFLSVCFSTTAQAQVQTFSWEGRDREYIVHEPTTCANPTSRPVLFFLHGLGDNIQRLEREFDFAGIANNWGWVVVMPQATDPSSIFGFDVGIGNMWNADLLPIFRVDDAGFLMALLDHLTPTCHINPDSVFFTGFSMGGFMTHRMAIEHGDRITAAVPFSGLITTALADKEPVVPVRILIVHGTSDNVVCYDGSTKTFPLPQLGISVEEGIQYWCKANHCNPEPAYEELPDFQDDGLLFERYTYGGGEAEVQHLKVIGGTHTWYDDTNKYDLSYVDELHDFFIQNIIPDRLAAIPDKAPTGPMQIFTPEGKQAPRLSRGINIIRQGGKIRKVVR